MYLATRMYTFSKVIWESLFQRVPDKEIKLIYYLVLVRSTENWIPRQVVKESQNKDQNHNQELTIFLKNKIQTKHLKNT